MKENLFEKFGNMNQNEINLSLYHSAKKGNIDEVHYLLTSTELKHNADVHCQNDEALHTSYFYGHLELTKYLVSSPLLKEHADIHSRNDQMFVFCYGNYSETSYYNFLNFLIFELKIQKTPKIISYMEEYQTEEFKKAFDSRDLSEDLVPSLNDNKNKPKAKI